MKLIIELHPFLTAATAVCAIGLLAIVTSIWGAGDDCLNRCDHCGETIDGEHKCFAPDSSNWGKE